VGAGSGFLILIIIGLPFYIISLVTIKRAFKAERIVTDGTFGMCRHQVYSAWIIFFIPGMMLLINTWIGLSALIGMYFLIQMFAKEEDIYLEKNIWHIRREFPWYYLLVG